jgi:hypothetical protein
MPEFEGHNSTVHHDHILEMIANYLEGGDMALDGYLRAHGDHSLNRIKEAIPDFIDSVMGIQAIPYATPVEAQELLDNELVISPNTLGGVIAQLRLISFAGRNGAGEIALVGATVRSWVLGICQADGGSGFANTSFESAITVADQIQQVSVENLSANHYVALLYVV